MSLANDNFCFHYLRHHPFPPPPPESVYIFQTPPFLLPFFFGGGTPISHQPPLQQVFVNAPLQDYQITNPTPLTPAKIIFRVKNFLCLSHMLSWTLLLFNFFVISFIFGDLTIRSPTHAVLCCLVTQRSSIPTQLPPTASSSTWTKLSIGTASMYGKWKLFCLTASLQIKTSNFKSTCGRNPHGTGHRHPT